MILFVPTGNAKVETLECFKFGLNKAHSNEQVPGLVLVYAYKIPLHIDALFSWPFSLHPPPKSQVFYMVHLDDTIPKCMRGFC